jgi:formate hydrogenlyase subunit 3/multisubunit Na+/H+ antiporter MnhD subunit
VSIAKRIKAFNRAELGSIAFYAVAGLILLAFLPLTGFPPHVGFIAILSLITAYSIFTNRAWAPWLVAILLIINSVFAFYTLYAAGFSNALLAVGLIVFAVLTWLVTIYLLLKRES